MRTSRRSVLRLGAIAMLGWLFRARATQAARRRVRGLYFPGHRLGDPDAVAAFKETVLQTGANAAVVDVKGDNGIVHLTFEHPLKPGRAPRYAYPDSLADLLSWCQAHAIQPVARQVVFQDHWLAHAHPSHALVDQRGRVWRGPDGQGLAYTDPFSEDIHDYNAAVAAAAAELGFSEVQFDYVRFPAGIIGGIAFRRPWTFENRTAAIARFLEAAAARVRAAGATAAADVFGITAWDSAGDAGIGQYLELLAPHVDVICPMAYPSTYGTGIPDCYQGCQPGSAYPLEIVYHTTRRTLRRVQAVAPQVRVTPWIQAFADYRFYRAFGVQQFWDQQRGALAAGAKGVYCWQANGEYPANVFFSPPT